MPTLVYFGDNQDYSKLIEYFLRDVAGESFRVETINTSEPQTAIGQYWNNESAAVVVVEYPQDTPAIIQQLREHPNFGKAILSVITSRYKHYQALTNETTLIGDKTDILSMLEAALLQYRAPE